MTYSVYDIKVDNSISFTPGPTAGNVLAISGDGSTYWTEAAAPVDNKTFQTLTDAGTVSWNYSLGYNAKVILGGDRDLSITGATNGDYGTLFVIQDATGGRRINFPLTDKFKSGTYSFSSSANSTDIYSFIYDGSVYNWDYNLSVAKALDADADLFLTAAGITDATTINAINRFVIGLKTNSLWTKMTGLYPFVGSTATTHKWNLKDPRDLDAAFRLVFGGSVTHSSNGITGDGSTAYADTKIVPSTSMTNNNSHFSVYSRVNTAVDACDIGVSYAGSELVRLLIRFSDNNLYSNAYNGTTAQLITASTDSRGLFIQSRVTSSDHRIFRNGSQLGTTNTGAPSTLTNITRPIYIMANNNPAGLANPSNRNYSFASIGLGLSAAEASTFNTLVVALQTALGRNV